MNNDTIGTTLGQRTIGAGTPHLLPIRLTLLGLTLLGMVGMASSGNASMSPMAPQRTNNPPRRRGERSNVGGTKAAGVWEEAVWALQLPSGKMVEQRWTAVCGGAPVQVGYSCVVECYIH